MKRLLSVAIFLFFGFGCAVFRPYSASPERPLERSEIIYFRSLANVSRQESSFTFELAGYRHSGNHSMIIQGYLPPPTFKNLFVVYFTENSMLLRNQVDGEHGLYIFDEDVQEEYLAFLEMLSYALYAESHPDNQLRARWREDNSRTHLRLRRIPMVRRARYQYDFIAGQLQETRMEFPRGVVVRFSFHEYEQRLEMPDPARIFLISEKTRFPVYHITQDNFDKFIMDIIYAVESSM